MTYRTLAVVAAAFLLTGCSSGEEDGQAQPPEQAAPTSTPAAPTTLAPPTPSPSTVEAPCPYMDIDVVIDTVGQRLAKSTVTSTSPHMSCAFIRFDDKPAAEITVSEHETPPAAQTLALRTVGSDANPIPGLGEYGVGAVTDDGAIVAATSGTTLVVVKINQQSTLQARELASLVIAKL